MIKMLQNKNQHKKKHLEKHLITLLKFPVFFSFFFLQAYTNCEKKLYVKEA